MIIQIFESLHNHNNKMDRDLLIGNRIIDKKMKQYHKRKHRQTLYQIKKKSSSQNHQSLSSIDIKHHRRINTQIEDKYLDIEKKNILLFNKIASIIRDKPKQQFYHKPYGRTFQEANKSRRRFQERLKTENQIYQKRIYNQKATINNSQFYLDRKQNEKYLKLISKYPYASKNFDDKHDSPHDNSFFTEKEVYRKMTDEFFIRIRKTGSNQFEFIVEEDKQKKGGYKKEYSFLMDKNAYAEQLEKCGYDYDKLVSRLRLTASKQMIFDYS